MKKLSISARIALLYLAVFAVAQFVLGMGVWTAVRQHLYQIVDARLEQQADDLRAFMTARFSVDSTPARLREALQQTYANGQAADYLEIYADSGELIYRSAFLEAHQSDLLPPSKVKRSLVRSRQIEGKPFRFIFEKVNTVNEHAYVLELGIRADREVGTLFLIRNFLLVVSTLFLLCATGAGYWITRRMLTEVVRQTVLRQTALNSCDVSQTL
jgi:hypothetical protein